MNLEQIVDDWTKSRTKQGLADQVGCSLVTLNKKLNGSSELTFGEAERLAAALDISLETLSAAIKATSAGNGLGMA